MRRFFTTLSVLGVVGVGISGGAMAAGNLVADLVPTSNAIVCTAEVTNCESDGSGGASVSKLRGTNFLNTIVSGLLANQPYSIANNATGQDCAGVVGGFTTAADGSGSAIPTIGDAADYVVICRAQDSMLMPVMSGILGKLGRPGAP